MHEAPITAAEPPGPVPAMGPGYSVGQLTATSSG